MAAATRSMASGRAFWIFCLSASEPGGQSSKSGKVRLLRCLEFGLVSAGKERTLVARSASRIRNIIACGFQRLSVMCLVVRPLDVDIIQPFSKAATAFIYTLPVACFHHCWCWYSAHS